MADQEENNKHLSDIQKKILDAVIKDEVAIVRELLKDYKDKIDFLDYTGMTCLQHAAFKGKTEMSTLLLSRGADVNCNEHENGYTTLMFAALSGSADATQLMMESGAKVDAINSVGRTATQMAGFVGQHHCVAAINAYFGKEGLERYSKPQGLETDAKLQPDTFKSLLKLMNTFNLNPVKIFMFFRDNLCLLEKSEKVISVLEHMSQKYMKAKDTNDAMAMKTYYFSVLVKVACDAQKEEDGVNKLIKMVSKKSKKDGGFPVNQETYVYRLMAQFPYGDSQLYQNIKAQIKLSAKKKERISVLNLLVQGVNGQKFSFDEESDCSTCGTSSIDLKRCTKCKMVSYCGKECQKLDWAFHKTVCDELLAYSKEMVKEQNEKKIKEEIEQSKEIQERMKKAASLRAEFDKEREEELAEIMKKAEIHKAKIEAEEEAEKLQAEISSEAAR